MSSSLSPFPEWPAFLTQTGPSASFSYTSLLPQSLVSIPDVGGRKKIFRRSSALLVGFGGGLVGFFFFFCGVWPFFFLFFFSLCPGLLFLQPIEELGNTLNRPGDHQTFHPSSGRPDAHSCSLSPAPSRSSGLVFFFCTFLPRSHVGRQSLSCSPSDQSLHPPEFSVLLRIRASRLYLFLSSFLTPLFFFINLLFSRFKISFFDPLIVSLPRALQRLHFRAAGLIVFLS